MSTDARQEIKIKVRYDPSIQGDEAAKNLNIPPFVTFKVKPSTTMRSVYQLYVKRVDIRTMICRFVTEEGGRRISEHFSVQEAELQEEEVLLVFFESTGGGYA
jgi:hypothetical protein